MHSVFAQDQCWGNKSSPKYCTPLTYVDTTDTFKAPPTTSDCQDTCHTINEDAGDWEVDFSMDADDVHHSMILTHCGFAVGRGEGTPRNASFLLANQDILDLFDESINRFGPNHDGGISANGTMDCGDLHINWYIADLYA
ncbi:hypothetical protein F5Y19DRAFT_463392 [Xylariaceae sp. FL1651]|nr:hypothetical protein F5Y19DRAFT_463392 [Xylariaceae sp. FL1651]